MTELELSKHYLEFDENNFTKEDTKKLSELLAYHSDLYYNKEAPIISDFEYDILFKKLDNLEKKFKLSEKQTKKV
jgi:DNA ligase (NAD+)